MQDHVVALLATLALLGLAVLAIHLIRAKHTLHEVLTQAHEGAHNDASLAEASLTESQDAGR